MEPSTGLQQTETRLASLSSAVLTLLVQALTGHADIEVIHWTHKALSGGMGGGVGGTAIYRVGGEARHRSKAVQWSLILKVLYARSGEDPSDSHFWRREAEVYHSTLLDGLPDQLAAPRCMGVTEFPDDSCWLWLEEIQDEHPGSWSLEQHTHAARHLGQLSGTYLMRQSLPQHAWLSRNWIRQDVNRFGRIVLQLDALRRHPLIQHWLPDDTVATLQGLWAERDLFLTALDRLPQTLCHYDAFRRNLFSRKGQTVLVDWSFVGMGPLGAELVAPFWVNAIFEEIAVADMKTLDADLFESYVNGLRDAGWQGDIQQVRLGYCAALGLRWLAGVGIQAGEIADKLANGQTVTESYIDSMTAAGQIITQRVDEARQLMNQA